MSELKEIQKELKALEGLISDIKNEVRDRLTPSKRRAYLHRRFDELSRKWEALKRKEHFALLKTKKGKSFDELVKELYG